MKCITIRSAALICALNLWVGHAFGTTIDFTIDSSQSSLTLAGSVDLSVVGLGDYPLTPQGTGALTATLSGTVLADGDLLSSISFAGGSSIVPAITGHWTPAPGGAAGTQPAQYGAQLIVPPVGGGTDVAYNDMNFDLTSASLPVAGGMFDASQLIVVLLSASADYRSFGEIAGSFGSDQQASSESDPNQLASGSITLSGDLATLVIPIKVQIFSNFFENPADISVTGQIVATALVPEPSSALLLGCGICFALGMRRYRFS